MRIRELSKELGLSNNDIINKLKELGITGKVASSGITAEEEQKLRKVTAAEKKADKPSEKPVPNVSEKTEKTVSEHRNDRHSGRNDRNDKHNSDRRNGGNMENNERRNNNGNSNNERRGGANSDRRGGNNSGNNDRRSNNSGNNDRRGGGAGNGERRSGGNFGNNDRRSNNANNDRRNNNSGSERRSGNSGNNDRNNHNNGNFGNSDRRGGSNSGGERRSGGNFGNNERRSNVRNDKRSSSEVNDRFTSSLNSGDRFGNKNSGKGNNKNKANRQDSFKSENENFVNDAFPKQNKKNKKKNKNKPAAVQVTVPEPEPEVVEEEISVIEMGASITVGDLAEKLGKKSSEIIMKLMAQGVMASINQEIERELAETICEDYGVIVEDEVERDIAEEIFASEEDDEKDLVERPPVVVVMGHVDHGKTSLLDAIRKTKVTADEAGGITQHIGAYTVSINNKPITFLDTPGHEAFTAMRMRGALVTDIAVLVVAADDGVMSQTVEAINHAKAAGVEIIVAINKIDKPSANPDRVKQELTEYGLLVEDWGGETIAVPVSAVTKEGIDQLLEMIILVAEMKELKANPNKKASGNIIEARLDKGRGPIATALVKAGTLKVGDPIVVGGAFGRVRAMVNDKGKQIKKAGPSIPVEILGLNDVPHAGDMFYVAKNEKQARQVAETIIAKSRVDMLKETQKVSLEDLFSQIQSGNMKELNIVIKADVQGSVGAVRASLEKLSNDEVRIRTIHGGVGAITESDVMLASASNAIIIGFNVRPEASAKSVAEDQKVDIRLYRVIYNAIDDIRAAIKGMLDPEYVEKILGHAEVRQIFNASGVGTIAGSYVKDGKITRNSKVRLLRDNVVVYEGEVATLRRYKDDVKEVATNFECGILLNKFNDVKLGDIIEAFVMEEIKR